MLERLDRIICAFELEDGSFELWFLKPEKYKSAMRDTASRGPSAGRVGIVKKSVFQSEGLLVTRVRI
jgi:hypothetical protein